MHAVGVFFFVISRGMKNRILSFARRLKQPRYLIGALAGAAYIYWFFLQPFRSFGKHAASAPENAQQFAGMLAFLQIAFAWIFGAKGQGIVFRESEVLLFFPAPITRKELLLYKWMQDQIGVLVYSGFFFMAMKGMGAPSSGFAFLGLYLMSNALALHGMTARLVSLYLRDRGGMVRLLLAVPVVLLALGLVEAVQRAMDVPSSRFAFDFGAIFRPHPENPLANVLGFVTRPIIAADLGDFLTVAWPVALLAVAFGAIVVLLDVRFEEQATALAGKITRIREGGLQAARDRSKLVIGPNYRPLFRLAPMGRPWVAFYWKNLISIGRVRRIGWFLLPLLFAFVFFIVSKGLGPRSSRDTLSVVGGILFLLAGYIALLGPAMLRVDLRVDLAHFDVIKALPVRGRQLIFGEVMATATTVWAVQLPMLVGSLVCIARIGPIAFTPGVQAAVFVGAAAGFLGIDLVITTLQNLLALYFPSFIRLGNSVKGGFDNFGQNLIGGFLGLFAFFVALIPAGAAGIAGFGFLFALFFEAGSPIPFALAAVPTGGLYALEAWILMTLAERRYETFDLSHENLQHDS